MFGRYFMLNLKDQLLKKGLVTKAQVEKIEKEQNSKNHPKSFDEFNQEKALEKLKSQNKAEKYATIRKWVDLNRLDKSQKMLEGEKFFFETIEKEISWLTLDLELIKDIKEGKAAIIAYMSHHGLTHAVIGKEIASDIAQIFPDWIRVFNRR